MALSRFHDARGARHRGMHDLGDRARLRVVEAKRPSDVHETVPLVAELWALAVFASVHVQ